MNDWQNDQAPSQSSDGEGGSGRTSLTIAKGIWAFLLITVIAYCGLYWISWAGLFLVLMFLVPLTKLVPIVAALGVYLGFKESDAQYEREARTGMALNAVAFIIGAVLVVSW